MKNEIIFLNVSRLKGLTGKEINYVSDVPIKLVNNLEMKMDSIAFDGDNVCLSPTIEIFYDPDLESDLVFAEQVMDQFKEYFDKDGSINYFIDKSPYGCMIFSILYPIRDVMDNYVDYESWRNIFENSIMVDFLRESDFKNSIS